MADHISIEGRSRIMRAIRSKNTEPERAVRRLLHAQGYRYSLHSRDLPGKPDIVFPGRRKVIFVHGCFWHQHNDGSCPIAQKPTSNKAYWLPKLKRNAQRDRQHVEQLKQRGWSVHLVWECELKKPRVLLVRLCRFLKAIPLDMNMSCPT